MPNWNSNKVIVNGSDYEINRLIEMGMKGKDEFSMDNILPTPKNENGEPFDQWYSWRVENWGTKWDMDEVEMDRDNRELVLDYNTAWSPNLEFWDTVAEMFPKLEIELSYYEGGMVFCGYDKWLDGQRVEDNHFDFNDMEGDTEVEMWKNFADLLNSLSFGWAATDIMEYTIKEIEEEENNEG